MNHSREFKTFVMIPEEIIDELIQAKRDLKKIRDNIGQEDQTAALNEYITEEKAMGLIERGLTWFWNKRKSGELPGRKAAGRWYYKVTDINKYIENGKTI